MKNILIGLLILSSTAFAADININGNYFTPAEGTLGSEDYFPPYLTVVKDGAMIDYEIINGAVLVEEIAYTVKSNVVTVKQPKTIEIKYDCNGEEVIVGGDDAFETSAIMIKKSTGITSTVTYDGETMSITVRNATAKEISETLALPRCTLK